MEIGKRYIL